MEIMRGQAAAGSRARALHARVFDAALLAFAIMPPTIVATVYAMFLLNGQRPVGYPWHLVTYGSYSIVALTGRHASRRPARLAGFAVIAFWLLMTIMTVSLILFVTSSATGLALAIERSLPD